MVALAVWRFFEKKFSGYLGNDWGSINFCYSTTKWANRPQGSMRVVSSFQWYILAEGSSAKEARAWHGGLVNGTVVDPGRIRQTGIPG